MTQLKREWTAEEEALLGTMADGRVGFRLDRATTAVRHRRIELGVPAYGYGPNGRPFFAWKLVKANRP